MNEALRREYGVLLTTAGPLLVQRAREYRAVVELLAMKGGKGSGAAIQFLEAQAERAEEAVVNIGRAFGGS